MRPAPLLWNALGLALAGLAYAAGAAMPHAIILAVFATVYAIGLWALATGRRGDVGYVGTLIVYVGLAGTVTGLIAALAGIDPSSAGTPAAAAALIATMLHGLGISLMSTLLGVLLNVWLSVSLRLQGAE